MIKNFNKRFEWNYDAILGIDEETYGASGEEILQIGNKIIECMRSFNACIEIKAVAVGITTLLYEIVPNAGVKVSSVLNVVDDLALCIAATGMRAIAPIPGRTAIGLEIPKKKRTLVPLFELMETEEFKNAESRTTAAIGFSNNEGPVIFDVSKAPHILISGATGMGKSSLIHSVILSIACKASPDEVRFILIDPKMVELTKYNSLPHTLAPVITNVQSAAKALLWACDEMERRYALIEAAHVRSIDAYNAAVREKPELGSGIPKIIIVIDELADLMHMAKKPTEISISKLAAKARAAGIHLIISTAKPSASIISGVIKANIPTRVSFKTVTSANSRAILDTNGAEQLLNNGDMLFMFPASYMPRRVQAAYISDAEADGLIEVLKAKYTDAVYNSEFVAAIFETDKGDEAKTPASASYVEASAEDYLKNVQFRDAVEIALKNGKVSTSLLQREMSIGFGKAQKFIEVMKELEIVKEKRVVVYSASITFDMWEDKISQLNNEGDKTEDKKDRADEGILSDQMFLDAVEIAVMYGKISTSLIQKKLSIGFGRAAKFIDWMEDMGIVSEPNQGKPRDVLITADEWHEKLSRLG